MAELVIHPNLYTIRRSLQSSVPPLLRADQAEERYNEAVQAAVEKCAADTAGQTCFICMEAVHSRTGEGLVRGCACRGGAGFAHVSCLAEQAKILFAEAEENNLGVEVLNARLGRWSDCSLCEQEYHGVVRCALGWACWKTYVGRPERDQVRGLAMTVLGNGLTGANRYEDALSVREAELSMLRRLGASERSVLAVQGNLAVLYEELGRVEGALRMKQDVYAGHLKLNGEDNVSTLMAANNYAATLKDLRRFEEAKALLRRTIPVARCVVGEGDGLTLRMRYTYARALYEDPRSDPRATLEYLREAVTTLEEIERTARRVFGGSHPLTVEIERFLHKIPSTVRRAADLESQVKRSV